MEKNLWSRIPKIDDLDEEKNQMHGVDEGPEGLKHHDKLERNVLF